LLWCVRNHVYQASEITHYVCITCLHPDKFIWCYSCLLECHHNHRKWRLVFKLTNVLVSIVAVVSLFVCGPACGLVVGAFASVLVGLEFDSRPGLSKVLWTGSVTFLPGAWFEGSCGNVSDELERYKPFVKSSHVGMPRSRNTFVEGQVRGAET